MVKVVLWWKSYGGKKITSRIVVKREVYVIVIQAASRICSEAPVASTEFIIRKYHFLELKPSEDATIKAATERVN